MNRLLFNTATVVTFFLGVVSCQENTNEIHNIINKNVIEDNTSLPKEKPPIKETLYFKKGIKEGTKERKCKAEGAKKRLYNTNLNNNKYEQMFDILFDKNFDFDRGGKVGCGFKIGKGVTGCNGKLSKANNGGSFRIMWIGINDPDSDKNNCKYDKVVTKEAYIIPYLYYKDMKGDCGASFDKKYQITRNKWYTIKMTFKANTKNKKNGIAILKIKKVGEKNFTTVLNKQNIRWSDTIKNTKITGIYYHFFRGGSTTEWASHRGGKVYIKNIYPALL